jgi:hypothetical protein
MDTPIHEEATLLVAILLVELHERREQMRREVNSSRRITSCRPPEPQVTGGSYSQHDE